MTPYISAVAAICSLEFFWRKYSAIGRTLSLKCAAFAIVGAMPASFAFPDGNAVDVYSPLVFSADELNGRRSHTLTVIGPCGRRSAPGAVAFCGSR